MHPVICTIGPFTVFSYGLMLVIAFVICSHLATDYARRQKVNADFIFNLIFLSLVSGIIGARIFYVIEHFSYYRENLIEIFALQKGGLSWFGGLTGGLIAGIYFVKKNKFSVLSICDLLMPYLALGQAIGRIGCLLNGCCYGRISQFGFYFPSHEAYLIPTQLYASLALIFIFLILKFFQEKPHLTGSIFFGYLFLYSVSRFSIEFFRADNPAVLFNLTLFQLLSIILFLFSIGGFIWIITKNQQARRNTK